MTNYRGDFGKEGSYYILRRGLKMKETFKRSTIVAIMAGVILMANALCWAEFQVNTYTTNDQARPAVAMDAAGNFVAVWRSEVQKEGSRGIYGQRFDPDGQKFGSEFLVNTSIGANQQQPDVAMDAAGNFVVSWNASDGSDEGIWARRYNASGTPITGEFLVNTYTDGRQLRPSIGMNDSGDFAVAWARWNHSIHEWFVCGRAYNAVGSPLGTEFVISQLPHGSNIDVAMDNSGDFAVAYHRNGDSNNRPLGYYVRMRQYNADTSPKGDAVQLTDNVDHTLSPSIATAGNGDLVITWSDGDIYAQRFDSSGNPVADAFVVNTTLAGSQYGPTVAMNDDGEAIIVWYDGDIWGQAYSNEGLVGGEFQINTYTLGDQRFPEIAMNDDGRFVTVWESNGQDGDGYGIFAETGSIFELRLPGDFDADGDVDGVDFSHWQIGYPTASGSDLDHGDADGDGDTDGVDFGIWQGNYPTNVGAAAMAVYSTPEPATLSLLALAGLTVLRQRRK